MRGDLNEPQAREYLAGGGLAGRVPLAQTDTRDPFLSGNLLDALGVSSSEMLEPSVGVRMPHQDEDLRPMASLRVAYEEHYLPLVRLCALLCGRRDLAEDIAQEAFVRAAKAVERLNLQEAGKYVRRAAVNIWKNRLRRMAIEQRLVALRHRESQVEQFPPVEERDVLWGALLRLPVRQRACIVLRYYEDLPEQEVADTLRCSVGTVKSQTSRALIRLREDLQHGF